VDKVRNDLCIYETENYGQFKRLEGNRDVACAKKIVESINEIGYVPNPIIVNEKFEVIDGQNRLSALEELGMPVQYYIIQEIGIEEARALNLGRTNWKPLDYVKSYAESGVYSYEILLSLYEENKKFLSLQEVLGILQNKIVYNGWCTTSIREGRFETSEADYERAVEIITALKPLKDTFKKMVGNRRTVTTGIAWCLSVESCDRKRLINVIETKYPLIRPVVTTDYYLQDITKLYNKGLKADKQVDFDVIARKESK